MLDAKLILDDNVALGAVATAASTNLIDVGAYETALGEEEHLRLRVEVSETATGAGAILEICGVHEVDETIDAASVVFAYSKALMANLKKGYVIMDIGLPVVHSRYLALWKEVTVANFTAGKINAYVYAR
jgi:hypothetical protein